MLGRAHELGQARRLVEVAKRRQALKLIELLKRKKAQRVEPELMIAATVGAAKGLRGEVFLNVRTDRVDEVFSKGAVLETNSETYPTVTVKSAREQSNRLLASFKEITSREAAEELRGTNLLVEPEEEDDAWYPHQLEGLSVRDTKGEDLGKVIGLEPGVAHDFLLVDYQGDRVMVPFVEEIVPQVDVEEGIVVLDPPQGLFDLNKG